MNTSSQLKLVVCGVALVSLSTIRSASAQIPCAPTDSGGASFAGTTDTGSGGGCFIRFDPGNQTKRIDYDGGHSFKVILSVTRTFYLNVDAVTTTDPNQGCPGEGCRYPDASETCIPYFFGALSCIRYDVTAYASPPPTTPIPQYQEHNYFSGRIHYRTAWNSPPDDNPRGLRAQDDASHFNDLTDAVFPGLVAGRDPGVDDAACGFSEYLVVHEPHATGLLGCFSHDGRDRGDGERGRRGDEGDGEHGGRGLNCSDPDNPNANVFDAGQTIPIKVVLRPENPAADLRLTYTDPGGLPHFAVASGHSNIGNMFRSADDHFEFNWSTKGLAPGIYALTISPGTTSGKLFAPRTIMVTLE